MKKLIISILIIIFIIVLAYFAFSPEKEEFTEKELAEEEFVLEEENLPEPAEEGKPALIELNGNLIINNPGFKENTWYLAYEEPGAAGLFKELILEEFDCLGSAEDCAAFFEMNSDLAGRRAKVIGQDNETKIKVFQINIRE